MKLLDGHVRWRSVGHSRRFDKQKTGRPTLVVAVLALGSSTCQLCRDEIHTNGREGDPCPELGCHP
jgi:hypothetical protein